MRNEKIYNEIMDNMKRQAENDLKIARSWKKVGHYTTKKDGTAFSDPARAYQNADGIQRVDRERVYWGTAVSLVNTEGYKLDITSLSVAGIKNRIAKTIKKAEDDYNYRMNLIAHMPEIFERLDSTLTAAFATLSDDTMEGEAWIMREALTSYIWEVVADECEAAKKREEQKTA